MTITYTLDVSSAKFSCFARLLMRWRGSIWKSVYRELGSWLIVYSLLSALYRMLLNKQQKHVFEDVVAFCYVYSDFIPLTFMLGFYVSLVVSRWWEMFNCLGWIDNIALYVAAYLHGTDEWSKMARRSIVRHMVLLEAMTLRDISPVVRRRFPTEESLQAAGLITATEVKAMKEIVSPNGKFWTPVQWSMSVIRQARQRGNITSERAVKEIYDRLREYRTALGMLQCYDWVPIPLVYTQVVFLAVRSYFVIALIGRQYVDGERHSVIRSPIDLYIPILSILQFVFFLGWMKVAEALVNPHGDDDDDFECNYLIDRNLQIGFSIVDGACNQELPLEKDAFWSDQVP
uniref:Bestrophin homolog n=1 Tax=Plectus sambesii TaxID=2011161 RepID=A0A914UNU4_9BILA